MARVEGVSFEQILNQEDFILIDTNVLSCIFSDSYRDKIYPAKKFLDLDERLLENVNEGTKLVGLWVREPKIHTTTKVSEEFEQFVDILNHKLKMLNWYEKSKRSNLKRDYYHGDMSPVRQQELMEEICWRYQTILKILKKSIYRPEENRVFKVLERMILELSEYSGVKNDLRDERIMIPKKYEDLHADEQLIAVSVYLSTIKNTSSAIITADSDIEKILKKTMELLFDFGTREGNVMLASLLD